MTSSAHPLRCKSAPRSPRRSQTTAAPAIATASVPAFWDTLERRWVRASCLPYPPYRANLGAWQIVTVSTRTIASDQSEHVDIPAGDCYLPLDRDVTGLVTIGGS